MVEKNVSARFRQEFGEDFLVVRAPGRINLIGEHTDYNEGFVLPAAIDKSIYLALGRSKSGSRIRSLDMDQEISFSVDESLSRDHKGWPNYLLGVLDQIQKAGKQISDFNCVFGGNIPMGGGLSSSAALECGLASGLNELFNLGFTKGQLIKMSQMAEHEFVGVKCGIMDQYASVMGKADHVMLLDCQSVEHTYYPLELADCSLLLCNSNVHHNLASSQYNVRRTQCEQGVALLHAQGEGVSSLRDVSTEMLDKHRGQFDPVVYSRCRYVVEENLRVAAFCQALVKKDFVKAGELLFRAHEGLSKEYEVSCPEIDFMVDYARTAEGVLGSRMMGGGFGGCTLNLIRKGSEDQFISGLSQAYQDKFGIEMTPIRVTICDGVEVRGLK